MKQKRLICRRPSSIIILLPLLFITAACTTKPEVVRAETALDHYLKNGDGSYSFNVNESYSIDGLEVYDLTLTSQQWHEYTWTHSLTVLAPEENKHDGALLFITGGKNKDGNPVKREGDDEFIHTLALLGLKKSMDAAQEFSAETLGHEISRFVLTGSSKRGWTTWLTGAVDPRVEAIAPMVIDVLNMPVNLDYQVRVWGDYSIQIEDHGKLGIPQQVHSDTSIEITTMIDPCA